MTRLKPIFKRYVIIGLSVYLFELIVIAVTQKLGGSSIFAVGVSFWLGLILSFILQKLVTFGDKRMHRKVLLPQIIAFSLLVIFNFGFTLAMAKIFGNTLPASLTRTIALGITTIWNFYLYKTSIFKWQDNVIY